MYEKDKNYRITVRLNKTQFDSVSEKSKILGVSHSDFMRMLINAIAYAEEKAREREHQGALEVATGEDN